MKSECNAEIEDAKGSKGGKRVPGQQLMDILQAQPSLWRKPCKFEVDKQMITYKIFTF